MKDIKQKLLELRDDLLKKSIEEDQQAKASREFGDLNQAAIYRGRASSSLEAREKVSDILNYIYEREGADNGSKNH